MLNQGHIYTHLNINDVYNKYKWFLTFQNLKKQQQQNNIFYDICSSPVVDRVISSKGICFLALTMCLN